MLLEAWGITGGLSYQLIMQIKANSIAYANKYKVNNCFDSCIWKPIKAHKMYHALGITLKMSIDNHHLDGIKLYFNPPQTMILGTRWVIIVMSFSALVADRIPEYHFLLICVALHPEIT